MNPAIHTTCFESPVGWVEVATSNEGLISVLFKDKDSGQHDKHPILEQAVHQLNGYFAGSIKRFRLPLAPQGTEFQQNVWQQLVNIPFGKSISYLALAKQLGDEKLIRAVGTANGRNPIAIIIPCHRVIGSDGSLTGYAGGLNRKRWLLQHEGILQPELF